MSKILIIDDDAFLSSIFKQKFEAEGFEAFAAGSGEDGLRMAGEKKPDVILLDLLMPRMDGFQVLEHLKSNPATQSIPVFIFTNLGQPGDIERCKSLGAAGYAIKTQTLPDEVVNQVKKLIGVP